MDKHLLEKLAVSLEGLARSVRDLIEAPVEEVTVAEAEPAETKEPDLTLDDVREALGRISLAGKNDAIKALVKEYAPKLSEVDPTCYGELIEKAQVIANATT